MGSSSFLRHGRPQLRAWVVVSLCATGLLLACGKVQGEGDDDIGDDDAPWLPDAQAEDGGPGRRDSGPGRRDSGDDPEDPPPFEEPECENPPPPISDFSCDPIAQDCPLPDEACMGFVMYPTSSCDAEYYGSACVPAGTGRQGDECGYGAECAAGFWCLITGAGTRCAKTCDLDDIDACDDGRVCMTTDVSGVGACL